MLLFLPKTEDHQNNENDMYIMTPPIVPKRIVTTVLVVDYFLSKDANTLLITLRMKHSMNTCHGE